MQQSFVDHDGYQCGYCTPGQICSRVGMLNEGHAKTEADIREQLSGNVCRCGAYPNIVAAVKHVMAHGPDRRWAMNNFQYVRVEGLDGAVRFVAGARRGEVHRWWNEPRRPDEYNVEKPSALVDLNRLSMRDVSSCRTAVCGSARW